MVELAATIIVFVWFWFWGWVICASIWDILVGRYGGPTANAFTSEQGRQRRAVRRQKRMNKQQMQNHQNCAMRKLQKARWIEIAYHRGKGDAQTPALIERLRQEADYEKWRAESYALNERHR